jgi:lipoyl(octanoyl) transferase
MVDFTVHVDPVSYPDALAQMQQRVDDILAGVAPELVWLLEHDPCYTGGTSAKASDLINPQFPVYDTGRGGQYTYHGPGQLIAYLMLDLKKHQQITDLRKYIFDLEQVIIDTLAEFEILGERREGRVGVWVVLPDGREEKIAAIGVRVRQWVTSHGLSININPDLSHYTGIVPCGIAEHGVTSFEKLGKDGRYVGAALLQNIKKTFQL